MPEIAALALSPEPGFPGNPVVKTGPWVVRGQPGLEVAVQKAMPQDRLPINQLDCRKTFENNGGGLGVERDVEFRGDAGIVETYISYLRKKIDAFDPPLIHTVRGVGYRLRMPAK